MLVKDGKGQGPSPCQGLYDTVVVEACGTQPLLASICEHRLRGAAQSTLRSGSVDEPLTFAHCLAYRFEVRSSNLSYLAGAAHAIVSTVKS